MRTSVYRIFHLAAAVAVLVAPLCVLADEEMEESADAATEVEERRTDEAALIEDPEAQRRARALAAREAAVGSTEELDELEPGGSLELYGSARVHAINNYVVETGKHSAKVGDGNSRVGARAEWQFESDWNLIGRGEFGFNALDTFSTRGDQFGDDDVDVRLAYLALGHKNLILAAGKNWSAYYSVANVTDRFAIFGGSASGIYNAGTAGSNTGTGRASDVFQARLNIGPRGKGLFKNLKPFNVNVQYQLGQDIPSSA